MSTPSLYILTHEFHPHRGGIATFTEEMARAAAGDGHQVEVWAQAAPAVRQEPAWPFRLRRLRLKGTHDLSCLIHLGRAFIQHRRSLRAATVYLPEPGPMLVLMYLQFFKSLRPKRLILTFHGSEILRFHRNPLTRCLTRRLIDRADRVSTLTQYTRDLLCARFPEAANKACLTPGALRAEFIQGLSSAPRSTSDPSRIIILTVGRLHPRKGQLQTLRALQALPAALHPRIEYHLAGTGGKGNYEATLRTAARQVGFPVVFHGPIPDNELGALYDQAHIFALTSVPHGPSVEGFGLVYLEASAHGLPVVAHAIGGVSEAVADGETGLLLPPDDPAALTTAFARLITNPALRHQLGTAGRAWAGRNCWPQSARMLFDEPAPADS